MNFKPKIVTCAAMALLLVSACTPTIVDGNSKGGIVESQSRLNIGFVGVEFESFAKRSQDIRAAIGSCSMMGVSNATCVRANVV